MEKIIAILNITRPVNVIITFSVVIVAAIISSEYFVLTGEIFLAAISAALVAASGNVINDYFDFEIDKINRSFRPLPAGYLNKNEALFIYIFLSSLAIIISIVISLKAFAIVFITSILLFFYSFYLKQKPLVGNIIVSTSTALAFIYGGMLVGNIALSLIPAFFAFLINLIREIIKDIEDIEGDRKNNMKTFPIKFGIEKSKFILLVLLILLFLATLVPVLFKFYKIEYFIIIMFFVNLPLVYFFRTITSEQFLNNISKLSMLIKLTMISGLIAIYLG